MQRGDKSPHYEQKDFKKCALLSKVIRFVVAQFIAHYMRLGFAIQMLHVAEN